MTKDQSTQTLSIEDMAAFCKRRGFIYPNSEIYGGMSGFFDFGPLGCELKNNIKQNWWKTFVQSREDVAGIDGTIITHPGVWRASGHVDCFADLLIQCSKCKDKVRADHFLEDTIGKESNQTFDGIKADEVNALIKEHKLVCPKCKSEFSETKDFNLMFHTQVGPSSEKSNTAYLRPETAQLMFANFKLVMENARQKLPFGIAQMGKAFRNEISPRDFLFRSREFEQMEIEFFAHPQRIDDCPDFDTVKDIKIDLLTSDSQEKDNKPTSITIEKLPTSKWHAYWVGSMVKWFLDLGINPQNIRLREHKKTELAHYAKACFDIEYHFPFGWKEIHGSADRTTFDLQQHINTSGKDLSVYDEEAKEKIVPYVAAEPSQGVDRAFLAFLFDAYEDDKERGNIVLHLHPKLAPVKVGIFPLTNKLNEQAREVYMLLKDEFPVKFDKGGSVGRRYARADEEGTPCCITFDFDSLEDKSVTVRDRESTKQVRIKIDELKEKLHKFLNGENHDLFN